MVCIECAAIYVSLITKQWQPNKWRHLNTCQTQSVVQENNALFHLSLIVSGNVNYTELWHRKRAIFEENRRNIVNMEHVFVEWNRSVAVLRCYFLSYFFPFAFYAIETVVKHTFCAKQIKRNWCLFNFSDHIAIVVVFGMSSKFPIL